MAPIYMCCLSKCLSPVPTKCYIMWHLTSLQEYPKMNLKDKYCSCESFCHDSNNFKIAEIYSCNNVKIVLMQDKIVVLVSVIFIVACNFHILVPILRSQKLQKKLFSMENLLCCSSSLWRMYPIFRIQEGFYELFDAVSKTDHLIWITHSWSLLKGWVWAHLLLSPQNLLAHDELIQSLLFGPLTSRLGEVWQPQKVRVKNLCPLVLLWIGFKFPKLECCYELCYDYTRRGFRISTWAVKSFLKMRVPDVCWRAVDMCHYHSPDCTGTWGWGGDLYLSGAFRCLRRWMLCQAAQTGTDPCFPLDWTTGDTLWRGTRQPRGSPARVFWYIWRVVKSTPGRI